MANDVFNAGPLARAFMTNASDPAGLYQRNRKCQNRNNLLNIRIFILNTQNFTPPA